MNKAENKPPTSGKFETTMSPITISKLKAYYRIFGPQVFSPLFRNGKKKVKRERFRDVKYKEYIVSEDFILSMFSDTISKLHKQNPPFPLSKVDHKEITCMTTVENPILPHEKLLFRLEYWTVNNRSPNKIVVPNCQVKIYRDDEIVFRGTFDLIQCK
jgi:hypothetical protein